MEPDDKEDKKITTALVKLARAVRGAAAADVRRLLPQTWGLVRAGRQDADKVEEYAQTVAHRATVAAMVSAKIRALESASNEGALGAVLAMRGMLARLQLRVAYEHSTGSATKMTEPAVAEYTPGGTTLVVMLGDTHWILRSAKTWGDQWVSATGVRLDDLGQTRKSSGVEEPIVPLPSERTHRVSAVVRGAYAEPAIEGEKMHVLPLAGIRPGRSSGAVYRIQRHDIVAPTSFGGNNKAKAAARPKLDEQGLKNVLDAAFQSASAASEVSELPLDYRKLVVVHKLLALKLEHDTKNVPRAKDGKSAKVMLETTKISEIDVQIRESDVQWAIKIVQHGTKDSTAFLENIAEDLLRGSHEAVVGNMGGSGGLLSAVCDYIRLKAGTKSDVMPSWLLDKILSEPRTRLVGVDHLSRWPNSDKAGTAEIMRIREAIGALIKDKHIDVVLSDTCKDSKREKEVENIVTRAHMVCGTLLEHVTVIYMDMSAVIPDSPVLRIVRLYEYDQSIRRAISGAKTKLADAQHEIREVKWHVTDSASPSGHPYTDAFSPRGKSHLHSVAAMHPYTKLQILLVGQRDDPVWLTSFAMRHSALQNWSDSERDQIVRSAMAFIEKDHGKSVEEALGESVAEWAQKNASGILVSDIAKSEGLAVLALKLFKEVLDGATAKKKKDYDTNGTEHAIKNGFQRWLYEHGDSCTTAQRIRDSRKKANVAGNSDAKRADRLVDASILYTEILDFNAKDSSDEYVDDEIDAIHLAHEDLSELGDPPCLPRVLVLEGLNGGIHEYVKRCCCGDDHVPEPEHEEPMATHISQYKSTKVPDELSACMFVSLYVKGASKLEKELKEENAVGEVGISDLFKVCGGKWRAPNEFLVSVVRKSDIKKFKLKSQVDQVHAAVLLGELLRTEEGYDGRGEGKLIEPSRERSKSELVAHAARVLSEERVNQGDLNKIKEAYRYYKARANKLDAGDVFGPLYSPPWQRVPESDQKEESAYFGSSPTDVKDTISVGLGFRGKGARGKVSTLRDAYWTLSAAQRLDHAYVWRIFGFAGLVRMVRGKVQPVESIKATLTWIDASFKKSADGMVQEWKRSSRKGDVRDKYVEKAVNCGVHEWEFGIKYFAGRIEKSLEFEAWMDSIKAERDARDDEYKAHATGKDKLTGLAFMIGSRIVGDVVSVVTQEARTVQDEADLRLASAAVNALTELAERFGFVAGTVKYYNLAHVTRIAEESGEVTPEQRAVAALALSGVLFVVMDMLGLGSDAARLISEYLAALDRQLAHDVADVMELVARIVEDNDLFVAVKKAVKGTSGIVTGAVGLRSIAEALVRAIESPASLASVAAALREVRVPGKGRKVHTEIRVRADQMRKVADDLSLMRERGASRRETKGEAVTSSAEIERARATAKVNIMDVLGDLQMRTLHVTGGEVLVLDQEAPDPNGRPNVRVELIVPGGYERWPSAKDAFSTRFASVGGTVIGNATSWRGHLSGVCLLLVEESPELGTALRVEEESWRPIARVVPDALATRGRVVVMRGPRAESKEIAATKAVVLVVDAELAESIEKALDVAMVYAADGAESRASESAGMLAARLRPLLWKKEPRACGSSVVASKTPRSGSAHKPVERECVADAMVLEYRLVREAVRAFGIGVELRPEVVDGNNGGESITDFVGRFAAWNVIAESIAEHTLERMVKRYKEDLGKGPFDPLYPVKAGAIDDAHRRAKEIIAEAKKEDLTEPLGALTAWKKLGDKQQRDVKKTVDKGSLVEPDLKWKSKDESVPPKPVEEMIKESFGSS